MLETGTLTGKSSSDRLAWLGACYHVARSHGLSCESPRIHLSPPPQLWGYTWQLVHPGFLYGFWGFELRALYYIERTLQIKPFPQPLRVSFSLIKNVYHSHFIEKERGTEVANYFPQITQRFVVSTGSQEAAPPLPQTVLLYDWTGSDLILYNFGHYTLPVNKRFLMVQIVFMKTDNKYRLCGPSLTYGK